MCKRFPACLLSNFTAKPRLADRRSQGPTSFVLRLRISCSTIHPCIYNMVSLVAASRDGTSYSHGTRALDPKPFDLPHDQQCESQPPMSSLCCPTAVSLVCKLHIPNARLENGQRYAICVDSKPVTHRSFIIEDDCESEAPSSRRLILARDSR